MFRTATFILRQRLATSVAALLLVCGLTAQAQTSSFTYQGRLTDGAMPANGAYEMEFKLHDALIGGAQQPQPTPVTIALTDANSNAVLVTNGVFTVQLDFGADAFPVGHNPHGVAFDGTNIWVANVSDNTVTKRRASDGALLGTFAAGPSPKAIAYDGTYIWVTNSGNEITKLRASDGANMGTVKVGGNPAFIVFDGTNIWVTSPVSNTVSKR